MKTFILGCILTTSISELCAQADTLMNIEGKSTMGSNIGVISSINHTGFRGENNSVGFWSENSGIDGFYSLHNGGDGYQASFNDISGFQANNNEVDGFMQLTMQDMPPNLTSPNSRTGAAVRISHTDNFRVDLELGGHGRISADDSYVLYMNYNNGAIGNESFQIRDGTNNSNALIVHENGNATFAGVVTADDHTNSSDIRFKRNITLLSNTLSNLHLIKGVRYNWDQESYPKQNFSDRSQIGFIAQELEVVYPELVHTDDTGYKSVAYNKMTAVLVEAVKELNQELIKEINELRTENQRIKNQLLRIDLLESRLSKLEK